MSIRFVPPAALIALLAALLGVGPVRGQAKSIHRDGFAGRQTGFLRGDANIRFEEKDHKLSDEHCKSAATSEYIKIEATPPAGATEPEYVHYYYATPPAPVTDRLAAGLWVKAYRPGVQLKARLVLPKEKDPRNPDLPLSTLIAGETYEKVRQWQRLSLGDVPELVQRQLQVLRARLGRDIDPTDAYLDRIVVNVYAGPGTTEVWLDDLEIGPVRPDAAPAPPMATPVGRQGERKAVPVEFAEGQILVDGNPFFMLAIRHTGTPLKTLRDARLNTVWFPSDVPTEAIEEAIRHGFWIVPTLPLPAGEWEGRKPVRPDPAALEQEAETVAAFLRKFSAGDAALMWHFGDGRTAEDVFRVARAVDLVRTVDPRRPRSVGLWDGYSAYGTYVNAIGVHRWPLFSSLEMVQYREWLAQRKALIPPGKLTWTWVQTHVPEWYLQLVCGSPNPPHLADPIGPHPEQIRILTYLSLAAGHRGIGYWSDKFLENTYHGRDRLIELAMLNSEIEMLKPVLFSAQDPTRWYPTYGPGGYVNTNVQAAVIRGAKEILVLPVWLGNGTQYTPALGTVSNLTLRIPAVPDGTTPWLITPAGVTELKGVKRVAGGTEVIIPEFDITAAVVFTSDLGPTGKVVRWQDHTRKMAPLMARYAQQQAIEQFNKTWAIHHKILEAGGPDLPNGESADLFARAKQAIHEAKCYADNNQFDVAYREARRALRPLRTLMRAHWQKAVEGLDVPVASPYAASFYSLAQHWQLAREVASSRAGTNGFAHGGFELSKPAPEKGAEVSSLPGWKTRKLILDPVYATVAAIVNAEGLEDRPPDPRDPGTGRFSSQRVTPQPIDFRQPVLGRHCLTLQAYSAPEYDSQGRLQPPPLAVERIVVAVDSPPAEFPPGTLVRVSFWAKVPGVIYGSPDGLVVFDSAGGEPLGVRIPHTLEPPTYSGSWKQYHLYRRVPASGQIAMTFALTGLGIAYVDDVRIEPLIPGAR